MDIPLNAPVKCADGVAGRSTFVIFDPVSSRLTHLVVANRRDEHDDHLVPLDLVASATPDEIHLRCSLSELDELRPFTEAEYIKADVPHIEPRGLMEGYYTLPYVLAETQLLTHYHERVPPGELAVWRGARVSASDGAVGTVSELVVDPADGHITHLVLREGHLWGKRDVAIPVSKIERVDEDGVLLGLDKAGVEALPHVPVKRWWA